MGIKFKDIVSVDLITLNDLQGKIVAVDTMNVLYQFLTTIRAPDGQLLTYHEKVTSHLIGLFNRTLSLMEKGIKLVFVFDGEPPKMKKETLDVRRDTKDKIKELINKTSDLDLQKKLMSRTVSVTQEIVENSKELLSLMGCCIIQAPSEGEAQAAYLVSQGKCYAVVSQDYDNLIFGADRLIRNLNSDRDIELISLNKVLEENSIDKNDLINLACLVGTDFNPGGIHGIGPKKGLKLVKNQKVFPEFKEIVDLIKNMPVSEEDISFKKISDDLVSFLVSYGFNKERVESRLNKYKRGSVQTTLF